MSTMIDRFELSRDNETLVEFYAFPFNSPTIA
jgi:hypothetical protein